MSVPFLLLHSFIAHERVLSDCTISNSLSANRDRGRYKGFDPLYKYVGTALFFSLLLIDLPT